MKTNINLDSLEYITKEHISEICEKAVSKLKDAPLNQNGEFIKIFYDGTVELDISIMGGNSTFLEAIELARIEYVHPDYNSKSYIEDAELDAKNEDVVRDWDWNNFTVGSDFNNTCEMLEYDINQKIKDIQISDHSGLVFV